MQYVKNMNKKRSQVAHYVKCELLVARRPLTIFSHRSFSLAHSSGDVCVFVVSCLFHVFHIYTIYMSLALKYVYCVLLLCIDFKAYTKNRRLQRQWRMNTYPHQIESRDFLFVLFGFSFNCFVYALCALFLLLLLLLLYLRFCVSVCWLETQCFFHRFIRWHCCSVYFAKCKWERERIYVARTSSHRYTREKCTHLSSLCMSDCFIFYYCWFFFSLYECTIYSTHAISMD